MKKTLSFYLILAFFAVGCQKASTPASSVGGTTTSTTKYFLIKYTNSSGNQIITYQYDSNNRMIDEINVPNPIEQKFTYDNNNKITEWDEYTNGLPSNIYNLTYNTGSISVQITGLTTPKNNSNLILTLNSDNRVIESVYQNGSYETYTYDSAGNVLTLSVFATSASTTPLYTFKYTYDTHKSRFLDIKDNRSIFVVDLIQEATNNMLTSTYTSYTLPANSQTISYTYTYNADDYPVSRISTVVSGNSVGSIGTETFTYTTIKQ